MNILGKKNKNPKLTFTLSEDSDSSLNLNKDGVLVPIKTGGVTEFKNSSFTIPIPFDDDGDTLTLLVDICEKGLFSSEETSDSFSSSDSTMDKYFRINMAKHLDKMKIFSNGKCIPIPAEGIGLPYYGETIMFTLDNEMFPSYEPGKTYYGRYRWMDTASGITEWSGFILTYDFEDCRPIRMKYPENIQINTETLTSGPNSSGHVIDYLKGEIQKFVLTEDGKIDSSKIMNVPFGKVLAIIVEKTGSGTLTVIDGDSTMTYTDNKKYMIGAMNIGEMFVSVSESI